MDLFSKVLYQKKNPPPVLKEISSTNIISKQVVGIESKKNFFFCLILIMTKF